MERVSFYTVSKKMVTSHGGYLPVYQYGPQIRSWNSPDTFLESEVKVDHLPVQRFFFTLEDGSIENRFIALDRELEEIISIMIDDEVRSISENYRDQKVKYNAIINAYASRIRTINERTVWEVIKMKLANWWYK